MQNDNINDTNNQARVLRCFAPNLRPIQHVSHNARWKPARHRITTNDIYMNVVYGVCPHHDKLNI